MREDSSKGGFRNVLDTFEALTHTLDHLRARNAANGSNPELAARIERASALSLRGSALAREGLNQFPEERSKAIR